MKKFLLFPLTLAAVALLLSGKPISDCTCKSDRSGKSIPLYGKVQVVEQYADFKVRIVNNHPSLKVKVVENYPNSCGEWQFVENYPDFTIQFVDNYEDFTIEYVENYPGVR